MISDRDPDAVLWAACRKGSGEAFDILFRRHSGRVYLYCARLAGSTEDAEDSAAETFVELWRGRRKFETYNDSIAPILLAIAKRIVQKQHRSNSRRHAAHTRHEVQPINHVPSSDAQVLERLELDERLSWLASVVSKLPPQQRDVVHLCIYAEMSQAEVASILQIPIGTVKSRLHQARNLLASAVERSEPSHSTGVR
ncbi:RNA polymerase sigma factor [Knoellia sinensis]|uniref:RNA polymerase sigma factor n=1 Tax=Knoellia sinensis TaxID=136100 RepID=UPI0014701E01|nr:sigma-70 family RNA polymerase sigma factor [Knoellia sinensis]